MKAFILNAEGVTQRIGSILRKNNITPIKSYYKIVSLLLYQMYIQF